MPYWTTVLNWLQTMPDNYNYSIKPNYWNYSDVLHHDHGKLYLSNIGIQFDPYQVFHFKKKNNNYRRMIFFTSYRRFSRETSCCIKNASTQTRRNRHEYCNEIQVRISTNKTENKTCGGKIVRERVFSVGASCTTIIERFDDGNDVVRACVCVYYKCYKIKFILYERMNAQRRLWAASESVFLYLKIGFWCNHQYTNQMNNIYPLHFWYRV